MYDKLFLPENSTVKVPFLAYDDYLVDGKIIKWTGKMENVYSPICTQGGDRIKIGANVVLSSTVPWSTCSLVCPSRCFCVLAAREIFINIIVFKLFWL